MRLFIAEPSKTATTTEERQPRATPAVRPPAAKPTAPAKSCEKPNPAPAGPNMVATRTRIIAADWAPGSPFRRPHWRWLRAQVLVESGKRADRRFDDAWVRHARHYMTNVVRDGGKPNRRDQAIRDALSLAMDGGNIIRWRLEALLLTELDLSEVADRCELTPAVVEAFHALFLERPQPAEGPRLDFRACHRRPPPQRRSVGRGNLEGVRLRRRPSGLGGGDGRDRVDGVVARAAAGVGGPSRPRPALHAKDHRGAADAARHASGRVRPDGHRGQAAPQRQRTGRSGGGGDAQVLGGVQRPEGVPDHAAELSPGPVAGCLFGGGERGIAAHLAHHADGLEMAWEQRRRSRVYYQATWQNGRCVKRYVGPGAAGEDQARRDDARRGERAAQGVAFRDHLIRLEAADRALTDFGGMVELLVRAALLLSGLHHHRGAWREWRRYGPGGEEGRG